MRPYKSNLCAVLLPLFLGPIGLLYASTLASIIMLVCMLLILGAGQTLGLAGVLFLWVVGIYISTILVNRYNKMLDRNECHSKSSRCKKEQAPA